MCKDKVQGPRHLSEIQRVDQQGGGLDLPAALGAKEAPQLVLNGSSAPRRLPLERAEGYEVALGVEDLFHRNRTEGADQLVLQVCDAHIETQAFHIRAGEVGPETGSLERTLEVALLRCVTEARKPDVEALRAEPIQERSDVLRPTDGHDRDALGVEIPAAALSEGLERMLVAYSFHKYYGAWHPEEGIESHLVCATDSAKASRAEQNFSTVAQPASH